MDVFKSAARHLHALHSEEWSPWGLEKTMAPNWATSVGTSATESRSVDALLASTHWNGLVTYSFPDSRSDYEAGYLEASEAFAQVSYDQMQAVRFILDGRSPYSGGPKMALMGVEGFTNANFYDNGFDGADIRIGQSASANPTAYSYYPGNSPYGGDVWFGNAYDYRNPEVGNYAFLTILHELGHALGLKHPHEASGVTGTTASTERDALEYSVMSYNSYAGQSGSYYVNETFGYPQTYMMDDIAALQELYGADYTTRGGNNTYSWSPGTGETFVDGVAYGAPGGGAGGSANRIFLTVWDGGGIDTYDFSNYTSALTIDLRPGNFSTTGMTQRAYLGDGHYAKGNIYNALLHDGDPRSLIENAVGGSGPDQITGNDAANKLEGRAGSDVLDGLLGSDVLIGGAGVDTFVFSTAPSPTNVDQITDFVVADDTIQLSKAIFTALTTTGILAAEAFYTGSTAHDASDRILYDRNTGSLVYDQDGTGSAAALKFAQLAPGLSLTNADFLIA
ncbi:M10 family metallopeptidase [Microvirga massiliensis]|uniref:M10 family metallopeptidase n=1 Tax=Microvirga massiliensis TaxID=1033741 RepID=UPI0009E567F5|nr:M10 family metallopeptidase [Microvirga massiliensis]